jgi:hypothetical protein
VTGTQKAEAQTVSYFAPLYVCSRFMYVRKPAQGRTRTLYADAHSQPERAIEERQIVVSPAARAGLILRRLLSQTNWGRVRSFWTSERGRRTLNQPNKNDTRGRYPA